jgi:phage repressor protein C with HTH and peptisase S24 domain
MQYASGRRAARLYNFLIDPWVYITVLVNFMQDYVNNFGIDQLNQLLESVVMDIREIRRLNLLKILQERFDNKKSRLARAIDRADSYVHRLLWDPDQKNASPMGDSIARDVETKLSLAPYSLDQASFAANEKRAQYDVNLQPDTVSIAESDIKFSAGPGVTVFFESLEEGEPATYKLSWFRTQRIDPTRCKRFRVRGDSMEPLLFDRDVILVNLAETHVIDGRVYAIKIGDDLKVKRLRTRIDGAIVLESANLSYPSETISTEQLANITVIGRVREKSGAGGL